MLHPDFQKDESHHQQSLKCFLLTWVIDVPIYEFKIFTTLKI